MLLSLLACENSETPKPAADDTGSTTDEVVDTTCAPLDVVAEVSPYVTTVVTVRWRTEAPSTGYIAFDKTDALARTTPTTEPGTEHSMLLLGMTADTLVNFQVHSTSETCAVSTEVQTVTTGSLPSGLLPTRVTGPAPAWDGFQVIPMQGSSYHVVIVDEEGHYVWYDQIEATGNLMRAFLSADGESLVYMLAGPQNELEISKIVRVSLDGSTSTETPFPYADHDMVELPDGTITCIVVEDGEGGQADKLVELAPDGTFTEVFNSWDAWDPVELGLPMNGNWTHGNGLDYDATEDVYYFSMKNLESLAKITRTTGDVQWTMNGWLNQFAYTPESVFMHHQFELIDPDTILFFENGPPDRGYSRAVEVDFNTDTMTAEQVWSYTSDPPLYVFAKGDVHRFPDGTTQVVWSSAGQIQNVDRDGNVTWQLDLELGQAITFVHYVDSMYASQW
jgi:hypothetical protein